MLECGKGSVFPVWTSVETLNSGETVVGSSHFRVVKSRVDLGSKDDNEGTLAPFGERFTPFRSNRSTMVTEGLNDNTHRDRTQDGILNRSTLRPRQVGAG